MSKIDDAAAQVKKGTDKVADAAKAGAQKTGQALQDAGKAVKNLALAPAGSNPRAAAKAAAVAAAKAYAPGLLSPVQSRMEPQSPSPLPTAHSGRWLRRGNKIVLYGI